VSDFKTSSDISNQSSILLDSSHQLPSACRKTFRVSTLMRIADHEIPPQGQALSLHGEARSLEDWLFGHIAKPRIAATLQVKRFTKPGHMPSTIFPKKWSPFLNAHHDLPSHRGPAYRFSVGSRFTKLTRSQRTR
jgi:hypothetical protein